MKNYLFLFLILSFFGSSVFAANTELLTKALVKLINKQETLENAIFVLKENQNELNSKTENFQNINQNNIPSNSSNDNLDKSTKEQIIILNSQLEEVQKELEFAKNINKMKVNDGTKYKRNKKSIATIDEFILKNK